VRVAITDIRGSAPPLIAFTSAAGSADAIWRGDSPPELREYDVELDVPGQIRWGQDAEIDAMSAPGISRLGEEVRVVGRVLDYDDVGVLSLEFAGTLVMVQVADGPSPDVVVGTVVSVRVRQLEIYPSSI
jgi:hypothetical protein